MALWELSIREHWDRVLAIPAPTAEEALAAYGRDRSAATEMDFEYVGMEPDSELLVARDPSEPLPGPSSPGYAGDAHPELPVTELPLWRLDLRELWDRTFLVDAPDEDAAFDAFERDRDELLELSFEFRGLDTDGETVAPWGVA